MANRSTNFIQLVCEIGKKIDWIFVSIILILQYRFWAFPALLSHPDTTISSLGDGLYLFGIVLQNIVSWVGERQWFSLIGDHYTWYPNILGITAHMISPTLSFAVLVAITGKIILSFNLLIVLNLLLLQLGVYKLIHFYTRHRLIALLAAILLGTSSTLLIQAFTGHYHIGFYWPLPWIILLMERLLADRMNRGIGLVQSITFRYRFGPVWLGARAAMIFLLSLWLLAADWHVAIYSGLLLFFLFLFRAVDLVRWWKERRSMVIIPFGSLFAAALVMLPLGMLNTKIAHVFRASRSLLDVTATSIGLGINSFSFFGLHFIGKLLFRVLAFILPARSEKLLSALDRFSTVNIQTDLLSTILFWLAWILFLSCMWKGWKSWRRRNRTPSHIGRHVNSFPSSLMRIGYAYIWTGLLFCILAFGPYLMLFQTVYDRVPLLYYWFYRILPPLSAVRGPWRILIPATIILIVGFSIIFAVALSRHRKRIENLPHRKKAVSLSIVYSLVAILFGMIFVVQGRLSSAVAFPFPSKLFNLMPAFEGHSDVFVFGQETQGNSTFGTVVSLYNFQKGKRAIQWVAGGTAGYYPLEMNWLMRAMKLEQYPEIMVDLIEKKGVDLVLVDPSLGSGHESYRNLLEDALSRYFEQNVADRASTVGYEVWTRARDLPKKNPDQDQTPLSPLQYSLAIPFIHEEGATFPILLTIDNPSSTIYAPPDQVQAISYRFQWTQGDQVIASVTREMGEQAYILPEHGYSILVDPISVSLPRGEYLITVYRDEVPVTNSSVRVISSREYRQLVAKSEKELLRIRNHGAPVKWSLEGQPTAVALDFTIGSGAILNRDARSEVQPNLSVNAQYRSDPIVGEPWSISYQPSCLLNDNFFPGDHIRIYCEQYTPDPTKSNSWVTIPNLPIEQ